MAFAEASRNQRSHSPASKDYNSHLPASTRIIRFAPAYNDRDRPMRTDDFDYDLPSDLIAQNPVEHRAHSRLLVLDRHSGRIRHSRFDCLGSFLQPGDLLVANRTRVIPARLAARRASGGAVELLLLRMVRESVWETMARPGRKLRPGEVLSVDGSALRAVPEQRQPDGNWTVRFEGAQDVAAAVRAAGRLALPPYIRDSTSPDSRYQTVYADRDGSIAAPTAGLHFTHELLKELKRVGITAEYITLHVGPGTFKPVTADDVEDHRMHAEWGEVPAATAGAINTARSAGGRIIAVGTTTTRLLESAWSEGLAIPFQGETDRFIVPGYRFRVIEGLITNFHLPRSTLLMLVSAFAGRDNVLHAYREAIRERYRFYSFGDAMLII
jgi:S-adenosylmethionine:tRNA ribosyltransferase-isomerase